MEATERLGRVTDPVEASGYEKFSRFLRNELCDLLSGQIVQPGVGLLNGEFVQIFGSPSRKQNNTR